MGDIIRGSYDTHCAFYAVETQTACARGVTIKQRNGLPLGGEATTDLRAYGVTPGHTAGLIKGIVVALECCPKGSEGQWFAFQRYPHGAVGMFPNSSLL